MSCSLALVVDALQLFKDQVAAWTGHQCAVPAEGLDTVILAHCGWNVGFGTRDREKGRKSVAGFLELAQVIDSSLLGIRDHGVGREDWDTYGCNQQSSGDEMTIRDVAYLQEYPEMSITALSSPEVILPH